MPLRLRLPVNRPNAVLHERLRIALDRRRPLMECRSTTCYRIVNGAGDGVPNLVVDWLDSTMVARLDEDNPAPPGWLAALHAEAEQAGLAVRSIYPKIHPRSASEISPAQLKKLAPSQPIVGDPRPEIVVCEMGAKYLVRTHVGLSVGLFLDMREVREWVRQVSSGMQVLNLFAYTCAFGVAAHQGGAARVVNVDASRRYLAWGQQNYALNGIAAPAMDFLSGDAAEWLRRLRRRGERFDLVVLDPPSFGRAGRARFSAEHDLTSLVTLACDLVDNGGVLMATSNLRGLTPLVFNGEIERGVRLAGRRSRRLATWNEPTIDFPRPAAETPHLKVSALRLW